MSYWGRKQRQITQQKIKNGNKVLTEQGILNMQLNFANLFDTYSFLSDLQISDTLFSSLISSLLYGINLNNIIPDNITFEVELPDLQQWLNGVLIILKQIDLSSLLQNLAISFPSLNLQFNLSDLLFNLNFSFNFTIPTISFNLGQSQLTKAYYNQSAYGLSYYDPTAVTNFLKSTMYSAVIKKKNPITIKNEMLALKQSLNLADFVVDDIYNRLIAMKQVKETACLVDYCWVDYSTIPPQADTPHHDALVTFQTFDNRTVTIPVTNMLDIQAGCYVDLSYVDLCAVLDYDITGDNVYASGGASIETVHNAIYRSFKSRINVTPLAMANYQTAKARLDPHNSERVAYYGFSTTQLRQIEEVAGRIVKQLNPGVDAFTLRQYKVAVDNIYSSLFQQHRWGNEAQQAMTQQQLQQWWVSKWSANGLDPNVLNALFNAIYPLIIAQGKVRTSNRLNFLRKKLFG